MIQESRVSPEVAKLLRDKGFDEPCHYYYHNQELKFDCSLAGRNSYQHSNNVFSAPTHQMTKAWLREIHDILLWVYPIIPSPVTSDKTAFKWSWDGKKKWHSAHHFGGMYGESYDTPEEADDAAIKYAIEKLI